MSAELPGDFTPPVCDDCGLLMERDYEAEELAEDSVLWICWHPLGVSEVTE